MTRLEIYSLALCLAVLVGLVALFAYFLTHGIKQRVKLIALGDEDEAIQKEYEKSGKKSGAWDTVSKVFSICVTTLLCAVFAFAIYVNLTEDKRANGVPSLKVVQSASMSYKNSKNEYLVKNELNNQLQVYDMIVTRHLPDEFDLKLYDIVVYQAENGEMVIHRIVDIEEPNEKHPAHRYFRLQGDAIAYPDTYPVLYSQMRGIYVGERLPFVGSVVMFMQSPAGYFCIALILIFVIALPLLESKIKKAKQQRFAILQAAKQVEEEVVAGETEIGETADEGDGEVAVTAICEMPKQSAEGGDEDDSPFKKFAKKRNDADFAERLRACSDKTKQFHKEICAFLDEQSGVTKKQWKKHVVYRGRGKVLAKMSIRGKTLCLDLRLDPAAYRDTKYVFTDVSGYKKSATCPMRVKITSNRKVKWLKELFALALEQGGKR